MARSSIDYEDLIGVPYVRGGVSISQGVDCLGLVIECLHRFEFDVNLPDFDFSKGWQNRTAAYLAENAPRYFVRVEGDQWEIGDVIVTKPSATEPMHLGIVVEQDRVLHTREGLGAYTVSKRMFRPFARAVYRYKGRA